MMKSFVRKGKKEKKKENYFLKFPLLANLNFLTLFYLFSPRAGWGSLE
jgi:hypothetical protein